MGFYERLTCIVIEVRTVENVNKQEIIQRAIQNLISEFRVTPNKFLTEEDLRCYLYSLLLGDYGRLKKTKDDGKSISLHSEVRWYGNTGKLRLRSDLVILDVSSLETNEKDMKLKLPSKGYSFDGFFAIIEIKMRRIKGYSDNKFVDAVNKDRNKILAIRRESEPFANSFWSYIVICDKKHNMNLKPSQSDKHKELYVFARPAT